MSKRLIEKKKGNEVDENDIRPMKKRRRTSTTSATLAVPKEQQFRLFNANKPNMSRLNRLSCGYIRKYLTTRSITLADISQIVAKFLFEDWTFDFCYDFFEVPTIHEIEDNGKTIRCNCSGACFCFFSSFKIGMKHQSGIHKIMIKINKICNGCLENIIGIISQNSKNMKLNY